MEKESHPDTGALYTLSDLVEARILRHTDQRWENALQMVSDAFYGVWPDDEVEIDAFALRLATVEAALWCARDRMLTLGREVSPALDRAVATAARIRASGSSLQTLRDCRPDDAEPLIAAVEESMPVLMLRPCLADGAHTALCHALPVPPDHPKREGPDGLTRFCSRYRLVHQTLFGLVEPKVLISAERCRVIENDPVAGRYVTVDCPSESPCRTCTACPANAAPGILHCRRHQRENNARVAQFLQRKRARPDAQHQDDASSEPRDRTASPNGTTPRRTVKKKRKDAVVHLSEFVL